MIVRQRLWHTADRQRLVEDGHVDAAFLAYTPGDEIPDAEAAELGLLPRSSSSGRGKSRSRPADKSRTAAADKARDGAAGDGVGGDGVGGDAAGSGGEV